MIIVDIIDKLVSRIIDLLKEEQRMKKSIHDDFVEPLMVQFEQIHKDYVESFIRYRKIVQRGASIVQREHPMFREVEEDVLASSTLRIKLAALWKVIHERQHNPDKLLRLLRKIAVYLQFMTDLPQRGDLNIMMKNLIRETLFSDLIGARKDEVSLVLGELINDLQESFARIQESYQELRMELLK